MSTIILATANSHKVSEITALLGDRFTYLSLRDFPGAPTVVEDSPTFAGNALKKATELARFVTRTGLKRGADPSFVLADDSGLEVDALHGDPGVRSARFANPEGNENSPDLENNEKLLRLLRDVPPERRSARFRCAIALVPALPERIQSEVCNSTEMELRSEVFEGTCEGKIAMNPAGLGGFGYDPLFIPDGSAKSFAELGAAEKNRISHRARALEKLKARVDLFAD